MQNYRSKILLNIPYKNRYNFLSYLANQTTGFTNAIVKL
jgi:hypothetical protein